MSGGLMPTNIRLTNAEQEAIRRKAVEVNKALVKLGQPPLRDSELVHKILEKSVPYVRVSASGEIVVDAE